MKKCNLGRFGSTSDLKPLSECREGELRINPREKGFRRCLTRDVLVDWSGPSEVTVIGIT